MKFTNTLTNFFFFGVLATFATLLSLVSAAPVDIFKRDVFVPPITYPHAGTVWAVNSHHNVTWDTSSAPVNITNKQGEIYLRHNDLTDTSNALASGFDILLGRIEIQVPDVEPGTYELVLFGDSGNFSPDFTIEA
ncbi:uncharacterized protein STEHIDRAFT_108363 [Stereum hirsutum FP-91666 SS1]|uniref:uncharacterized protein n=1 Tax=Stereum hirsutum (strain FP-91666) TaxID=721885 RepID=UPI000440B1D7|nr:uncharacterized protein STEHIDRAFT_108363 [Stereum hirsutum FP-91666 SS1]EIM89685.1 hypothetical protein STEHIDRAFT_108363 [Stereum hirsutum FP-91666 SS1]